MTLSILDRVRYLAYLAGLPPVAAFRLDNGWWDRSYTSGMHERYAAREREWERLAIVATLALHGRQSSTVLDLGCGTGRLLDFVRERGAARYIGVDVSREALDDAQAHERKRLTNASDEWEQPAHGVEATWLHANLESWRPEIPVDVIVMNETMYYLSNPGAVLERMLASLRPGGVAVVSMWEDGRRFRQWRIVDQGMKRGGAVRDSTVRIRSGAIAWRIRRYVRLPNSSAS